LGGWCETGNPGLIKWSVSDEKAREVLIKHHIHRYLYHEAPLFTFDGYGIAGYWVNKLNKYRSG